MQCSRCNTTLVAGASFCGVCGSPVGRPGEAPLPGPNPIHNEVTMVAPLPPEMYMAQSPQMGYQAPAPTVPSAPFAPPPPVPQQPPGAWSPAPQQLPQQPPGAWAPAPQPVGAYVPGNAGASVAPPKRRKRKWPLRVALVLVVLLAVLAGSWFFGVRPYLNNLAKTQITQAIGDAQTQIFLLQPLLPTGPSIILLNEQQVNAYLSTHASDQLQNLQATITPTGLHLAFTVQGLSCAIDTMPIAVNGTIQVTNVQTQGVLGLVLSGDELMNILNTSLPNLVQQMNRKIDKVTLRDHVMEIRMH